MQSLQQFNEKVPRDLLNAVVAHRGFHDPKDSLERPIENTLNAFVSVWSGSHTLNMCECDVTTTKDGVVVVAHDRNFDRLAKAKSQLSSASVETKTFNELSSLELKDGSKVLALKDLLVNLQKYPNGRLIIEIKETVNVDVLIAFFLENSDLLKQVPVIMSFERYICFKVKSALQEKANVMLLVEMTKGSERRQQLKFMDSTMSVSSFDLRTSASSDIIQEVFLKQNSVALDGIYFQYQHEMMTDRLIHNTLQYLSTKVKTGVFLAGSDRKADKITTLKQLYKVGVSYINSDIPEGDVYFKD